MNISEDYRKILADEIRIVRTKINEEKDVRKKIFYYSAIYGMTRRIFNLNFDPHLLFMDIIFNVTYNIILNRINSIIAGDNTIPISKEFFDNLCECLNILEERVRNNEDTYDILQKIANLTYTVDGNGYYLTQKGINVYQ